MPLLGLHHWRRSRVYPERQEFGQSAGHTLLSECLVPYMPGRLEVVAYEKGMRVGYDCIETVGDTSALRISADKPVLKANGSDLAYVDNILVDEQARRVYHEEFEINVTVSGPGTLEGLGSGNPCTHENFNTDHRKTYNGRITAIIRAGQQPGKIHLTAAVSGLPSAAAAITVE